MLATEGVLDLTGHFHGDERVILSVRISEASGLVDFETGVPPLTARVVDLVAADAIPVRLSFRLGNATQAAAFFENVSCEPYRSLADRDQSRALLLHWTRDGRTLLDGSSVASCAGG